MKTYLFAGASSQIALATAQLLQAQGNEVIGLSRQPEIEIYDQYYQVEGYSKNDFPVIDQTIDGIIYFPGSINLKPFHRLNSADFAHDYQLNALGAVEFTQAYLGNLKASESPAIVYLSSVAATLGLPFHTSIAMAKGAIEALTRSLAAELAPRIRVNCVAPSLTNTDLGNKFLNTPEKFEASQNRNPMKKVGEPQEIAKSIVFLITQDASWITGQVINVDGGMNNLKTS
jgi:NAD(P)-dependent dehydrogenase (short-subunit alcohol dehydrogenase family)